MKASVFRRWPVTAPYRGEQTTRLTGGHDLKYRCLLRDIRQTYGIMRDIKVNGKIESVDIERTVD